jgi:hypothetical protein
MSHNVALKYYYFCLQPLTKASNITCGNEKVANPVFLDSLWWLSPLLFKCFQGSYKSIEELGLKESPPAQLHTGGRHTYDRVPAGAQKGSSVTPLSLLLYHAASAQYLTP